ARRCSRLARLAFQARHELVQAQLLQCPRHGLQLVRAELDQRLALAHQIQGLVQARLARVETADDLLYARGPRLVGLRPLPGRRPVLAPAVAGTVPSAKRNSSSHAIRACEAVAIGAPSREATSA